jgi:cytochrome c553
MSLRHTLHLSLALAALAFAGNALAAGKIGDVAAGKKRAEDLKCASCHGDGDKALDASYPRLAGQYPDYLAKALRDYRSGKRKNAVMLGQAQPLTDEEIDNLAAYYGSLDGEIHDLSQHSEK